MLGGSTGLGDFILATRKLLACSELTAMGLMGLLGFAWTHARAVCTGVGCMLKGAG